MNSSTNQNSTQSEILTVSLTNAAGNVTNTEKDKEICRDYLWGTCNKGTACRFRHEFDFEKVKKTLKFCHDYQNRSGCTREVCGYLHATKEEQNLFFSSGKLPKVLAERHANMTSETIPQIAMFIKKSLMGTSTHSMTINQPAPPVVAPLPPPVMGPMFPPAISKQVQPQMLPTPVPPPGPPPGPPPAPSLPVMSLQHLPPPPPPPTQHSATIPQPTAPTYSASTHMAYQMNQSVPGTVQKFDPSKPPPPLPHVHNGALKRPSPNALEAGPSKIRKEDDLNDASLCDYCLQRQIRVDACKKEMDDMYAREECQMLIYKKKMEQCQKKKDLLKSLVSPELFRLLEDFVEEDTQYQDVLSQNQTFNMSTDRQLLDYFLSKKKNNDTKQPTSPRTEDRLNSLFASIRSNAKKQEPPNSANSPSTKNQNSVSKGLTSVAGSKAGCSTTASTPHTYPVYTAPPPMTRPYAPQTVNPPLPNTSTHSQHNGLSTTAPKPGSCMVPPPPPNGNQNCQPYNTAGPYPPPTSFYNPYQ